MTVFVVDAKQILLKAWSCRLAYLASAFGFLEVALPAVELALPALQGLVPPGAFTILAAVTSAGIPIARVLSQKVFKNE